MKDRLVTLQSVINAQEVASVVIDNEYRIVMANEAYCASYGITSEQVIGRRCHEVSHHSAVPCHLNGEQCPHHEVFSTAKAFEVLHSHYDSNNHPEHVRIKAHPLQDADGQNYLMETIYRLVPSADLSCEEMQMVGRSPAFLNCVENLTVAAKSDAPVLIYGESGVGKELAAKFIHEQSERNKKAYVELNCAAIPESLCESELFGHERGSFTGCGGLKRGLFELANNGSLFLDEIGEMSLAIQAKFLRVLDSGEFRRIGGEKTYNTDVRIIAATNQNLMAKVAAGTFREDLYFRIAGIRVSIPPLRERRMDIPALADALLKRLYKRHGVCRLTQDAIERLINHNYPGNVRELRNILQKAVALSHDNIISAKHIQLNDQGVFPMREQASQTPPAHTTAIPSGIPSETTLSMSKLEAQHIARLLREHDENRRIVANILGVSERTLYRKIKRYGLHAE